LALAYEIVITEVTLYGTKLRCVAGFDLERGEMVRPEPEAAGFWPQIVCGAGTTFHPGHVVRFRGHKPDTDWPHRTEDIVVAGDPIRVGALSAKEFRAVLGKAAALNPQAVFGDHLIIDGVKGYVPAGSRCGSLAGLTVPSETLRFHDDEYEGEHHLRARVIVNGRRLDLSIAAKDLKQAFHRGGLQAVRDLAPRRGPVQVRLGLSRPFVKIPDKCYLQVNGIHAL